MEGIHWLLNLTLHTVGRGSDGKTRKDRGRKPLVIDVTMSSDGNIKKKGHKNLYKYKWSLW